MDIMKIREQMRLSDDMSLVNLSMTLTNESIIRLKALFDMGVLEAARDEAVVSRKGYTRKELKEAFDLVCDKENWKNPIYAAIDMGEDWVKQRNMIAEAVVFYTGSYPSFYLRSGEKVVVRADGYYKTIGS